MTARRGPRQTGQTRASTRAGIALAAGARALFLLALSACGTLSSVSDSVLGTKAPPEGVAGHVQGFLGGVAGDEPRAVLVGREVLSAGGNAADAAVAMGLALAVTMPSRAGLGGGGACLAYDPDEKSVNQGVPEAMLFVPKAPSQPGPGDRPAAVPMLARGLFALHARYGRRPFETLISPAEQFARFGVPVSRAFARDLAEVAGPLFADPSARAVFSDGSAALGEGGRMVQPDLGATLAQLRASGVGDLYQGALARRIEAGAPQAGAFLTIADLREALPQTSPALTVPAGRDMVAFLPPPADGGLAAAAAFNVLRANPANVEAAGARAAAVASRWREAGGDPQAVLAADAPGASLPDLPASTSYVVLDRDGGAVACVLTMNNLFGTGRVIPGTGMLLAASPASVPPPLLSAAMAWNSRIHAFRAEVAASGQGGAPLAAAFGMDATLRSTAPMPAPVPEPGRANAITCARYLPDNDRSCGWATDPRGFGLAVGSN